MSARASTHTRVSADIAAAAASVTPSEHRSVAEQINHWARLGMQVERSASVGGRQVLAAITGDAQFSSLTPEERVVAHAAIDAQMAERVTEARFGPEARKAGQVTVSVDDDGTLIEIAPDGSRRVL